ncbi:recombination protein RecR [bacterium]|nr:recombination protein RecR [bacterium]
MNGLSPALERLIESIAKLPGLGKKSATRLAMHILSKPETEARILAQAILDVKTKIRLCDSCGNLTEEELCGICRDAKRDSGLLCIVESPQDILRLEKAAGFRGLYHVLGGILSPLDGIGPDSLRMNELWDRIQEQNFREIILALSPTADGDATTLYLMNELRARGLKVTRLARGIPIGAELEQVDEITLARALEERTRME